MRVGETRRVEVLSRGDVIGLGDPKSASIFGKQPNIICIDDAILRLYCIRVDG